MSHHWEGADAKNEFKKYAPKLKPLTEVGTRVIIDDPIDELVNAFLNGAFQKMVSETWWEIITKFGAKIFVNVNGVDKVVMAPKEYDDKDNLPNDFKIYEKENFNIKIQNKDYRVKKLFLAYSPNEELSEEIRGIAVQRGGMMVERLEPRYIPKGEEEKIYGYITFDKPLDLEMARAEASTHYTFSWRRAFPREIKATIDIHVAKFLTEIGVTQNPEEKKNRKRREAEQHALNVANKSGKGIGYHRKRAWGKRGSGGGGGGGPVKDISINLSELFLPSENLRIEYDQSVKNIQAKISNHTSSPITALIKIFMTYGKDDVVHEFVEIEETIPAKSSKDIGSYEINMDSENFPSSGIYYIRANLISLMDSSKNN